MVEMQENSSDNPTLEEAKDPWDVLPRFPNARDFTGKLPEEFVQEWIKGKEEFIRLWKESEKFDIQLPYLVDLGWDEPFFGSLSRRIAKIRSASVPTAGVRILDGLIEMIWNPIFFAKVLTDPQVRGVLKHELYHLILEHVTSRRQTPHVLWNAATDCAINSLIPRKELPDFCLFPGELYVPPKAPKNWKPGLIARLIKEAPKEKSAEWYMSYFLNNEEVKNAMARAAAKSNYGAGEGEGDDKSGDAGDANAPGGNQGNHSKQKGRGKGKSNQERRFDDALRDELYNSGDGGQFDDHSIWDQLSEEQRDMMRDYMRDIFRDCVREAEREQNGWGNVPESIRAHLKKILSKEVDWRDLISQFVGRTRSTKTTSSIKRINRRFPWEHPGRKRAYSAKPAIAFDQSGSMSDWWVELLFAEICNLGNVTEYDVIPFDHTVDEKNIQHIRRGGQPKIIRTRQGGTDFNAPVRYINSKPGVYDCLFVLTDGGCDKPLKCDIPMAYILAPGCELMFDPGDTLVIRMTDTRK